MMLRLISRGMIVMLFPALVSAQPSAGLNPIYRRAQAMVNDGNTVGGHALIDSMIAIARPGSNEFAEALYWRAVLAATTGEAEMDYRRIIVDYSFSPRVEDALIRLAQLEIARANYDGALRHLSSLVQERPESPSRARASYWIARALFEKNDVQGGCVATADALVRTSEDDAELRNQLLYLNRRCAGVALAATPLQPIAGSMIDSVGRVATGTQPPMAPPTPPAPPAAVPNVLPNETTPRVEPSTSAPASVRTPGKAPMRPPAKPRDIEPSIVESEAPRSAEDAASSSLGKGMYSVQIAAYSLKSQADAMVARLKKRGYEARVDGTGAPFRVRIGHYGTQAQARAVQRSLKAKQVTGFVVRAETR